jgi:hypothetical protein
MTNATSLPPPILALVDALAAAAAADYLQSQVAPANDSIGKRPNPVQLLPPAEAA